jgi:hypothetical protein
MTLTAEKIEKLYRFYEEIADLEQRASDAINTAKANKALEILVKRPKGEAQVITEGMAWDEVYNLGPQCEAGQALKAKYPEAFSISADHSRKASELQTFSIAELGIDTKRIKVSDIIRLTDALIALRLPDMIAAANTK